MKNKKTAKVLLIAVIGLAVVLVAFLLIYFNGNTENYTWEEYTKMTEEEQMEFQNSFINYKAFEKWMEEAQIVKVDVPWENGGKKPSEYTWEEFEALTEGQQIKFQKSFKNFKDFEKWMEEAQIVEIDVPWESGGKKPSEYTWEEFEALTADQQMAFQNSFKTSDDFEKWMETATNEGTGISFEKDELFSVTWEEFEAMTGEEQMIFQNSFGGFEEFDKWLQANEPK